VYPGVGPPRDCQSHRLNPQYDRERALDLFLHGPRAYLARPARERRPVVLEQQPAAHRAAG
jgi:hypothetical protein